MILLDTHVLLWVVGSPEKLGSRARHTIERAGAVFVSSISFAEIEIKRGLGKLQINDEDLVGLSVAAGLRQLPLTDRHALKVSAFPSLIRHDPFDRLLLAQAMIEGLTFLTADQRLLELALDWIVDACE